MIKIIMSISILGLLVLGLFINFNYETYFKSLDQSNDLKSISKKISNYIDKYPLLIQKKFLQSVKIDPSIILTFKESLRYLRNKDPKAIALDDITWEDLSFSLEKFLTLWPKIEKDHSVLLKEFEWIAKHEENAPFKFTGYYHPLLEASRTPKEGYVALYALPKDKKKGVPYYERKDIRQGALDGKGLELAWAKDPFEAFLLEVQGSGCLRFEDGKIECLRYAGKNDRKYVSSRRILENHGLLEKADIIQQRKFFAEHPEYLELLNENPSFVFFSFSSGKEAYGTIGRPLHAWQSIAVDRKVIPLGSIVALDTVFPTIDGQTEVFKAITAAQDTGGAIRGKRIDIFCGDSEKAVFVAAKLDAEGVAWMLLAKDRPSSKKKQLEPPK